MKNSYIALYRQVRMGELTWRNLNGRFPFGSYANKIGRKALISHDLIADYSRDAYATGEWVYWRRVPSTGFLSEKAIAQYGKDWENL